jgi:hypothetical protein
MKKYFYLFADKNYKIIRNEENTRKLNRVARYIGGELITFEVGTNFISIFLNDYLYQQFYFKQDFEEVE